MIYVEMLGRTGNQMFSYSFARWLQLNNSKQQNEKIAFDFSRSQFNSQDSDVHELNDYICNANVRVENRKLHPLQRLVLRVFFGGMSKIQLGEASRQQYEERYQNLLNWFGIYICSFNYHKFNPRNIFKNNIVFGWYESADFFKSIDDVICEDFTLRDEVISGFSSELNQLVDNIIDSPGSVCINVRRGDFYSSDNRDFCAVCGPAYFEQAVKRMNELVAQPTYYVFSDDISWSEANLALPENTMFVDNKKYGLTPCTQMHVMTKCKNFIISNSTYSWWAQHLAIARNGGGICIAPGTWRNTAERTHEAIYENGWTLI